KSRWRAALPSAVGTSIEPRLRPLQVMPRPTEAARDYRLKFPASGGIGILVLCLQDPPNCPSTIQSHSPGARTWNLTRLMHLDIGRFDNGPPLLDFSPVVGEQAFWRLLLTRCDLVANISITLLHCWVAQGLNDSGVEPGNDRLRRSFWSTKTEIEDLIR